MVKKVIEVVLNLNTRRKRTQSRQNTSAHVYAQCIDTRALVLNARAHVLLRVRAHLCTDLYEIFFGSQLHLMNLSLKYHEDPSFC